MKINNDRIKSPCFIINKKILKENVDNIVLNCKKMHNNVIISYSLKTNSIPFLVKELYRKGLYIEVVSADEYKYAVKQGINKKKIIYNGVAKDKKTFLTAIKNKCIVNIDTYKEFEWLLESNIRNREIGIRINLPIDKELSSFFEFSDDGSRFGFCVENNNTLFNYIEKLKKRNISIIGLHFHCNTTNRTPLVYKKIINYSSRIIEENKFNIKYLDIGGGFLGGKENDFQKYSNIIDNEIKKCLNLHNIEIIIEPGAAITATAVLYYCKVIDKKQIKGKTFITVDGSITHINPTFSRKKYKYTSNCDMLSKNSKIIVCGFTCMERDRINIDKNLDLNIGDYLIFSNMGAYVMPFVPDFICHYPLIYLSDGTKIKRLKKKEKY